MKKLGIIVGVYNKNLIWDDVIVPTWRAEANFPKTTLSGAEIKQVVQWAAEPKVATEETEIIVKIIESKYEKANLEDISQSAHQVYVKEKFVLLHFIKDLEYLFD